MIYRTKYFYNVQTETVTLSNTHSTLSMVYKGCMIWKTRSIPYFFQNCDSFYPLFSPKKYTPCVFPSLFSQRLEASHIFSEFWYILSPIFSNIQLVVPYRPSLKYHTECMYPVNTGVGSGGMARVFRHFWHVTNADILPPPSRSILHLPSPAPPCVRPTASRRLRRITQAAMQAPSTSQLGRPFTHTCTRVAAAFGHYLDEQKYLVKVWWVLALRILRMWKWEVEI